MTYLPLGGMAVKAELGSAVMCALPMVDIEVERELSHLSVNSTHAHALIHTTRVSNETRVFKGCSTTGLEMFGFPVINKKGSVSDILKRVCSA